MILVKNKTLRKVLGIGIPFALVPLAVILGFWLPMTRAWLFATVAVTALSLLLFFCGYDERRIGTRRLVLVAVMTALCVVGRYFPVFKPMAALVILSGLYLGAEAGFLVGALSILVSNFTFGQGPWTPFQMFGFGMIGLLGGLLGEPLKRHRVLQLAYGFLSGLFYSFIMDVWTVLWAAGDFSLAQYASALYTAIPHTVLYALSGLGFLWLLGKPFGEKLERIKLVYGI